MKKLTLLVITILLSVPVFAQRNFNIQGVVKGFTEGEIYLVDADMSNYPHLDTLARGVIHKGRFTIKGRVPRLVAALIRIENTVNGPVVFLENTDYQIQLSVTQEMAYVDRAKKALYCLGNETESKIEGGKAQKLANAYLDNLRQLATQSEYLQARYHAAEQNNDPDSGKAIQNEWTKLKQDFDHRDDSLIRAFPDSYVFAYMIASNMDDLYEGDMIAYKYALLGQKDRQTVYGRQIAKRIAQLPKMKPGQKVPDFILTELNGKTFSLYQSTGKVKMIHIWSPSCGPCIDEMPKLAEIYREFHDKGGEWFSIPLGCSSKLGQQLIDKFSLSWVNLIRKDPTDSDIETLYSIRSFPTYIIVDRDNRILSVDTYSTMLLKEKLNEFLDSAQ